MKGRMAAAKSEHAIPPAKNAFSLMMGKPRPRGRPPKAAAAAAVAEPPPPKPTKKEAKRKSPPTTVSLTPKSAKASRQSTPASIRERPQRGRKSYKEADSDDDLLDDDDFEAKLAEEVGETDTKEIEEVVDAEEFERAQTLDVASMCSSSDHRTQHLLTFFRT
jgi:ATP-dependent DNA helicase